MSTSRGHRVGDSLSMVPAVLLCCLQSMGAVHPLVGWPGPGDTQPRGGDVAGDVVSFCKLTVRTLAHRFHVDEADLVERWSERAAMREYEGGMSREDAETAALADVRRWCNEREIGE
jgi:hypothetical protein